MEPTIAPVASMTVLLAPASACVTARMSALRLARRPSGTKAAVSAAADIIGSLNTEGPFLATESDLRQCGPCRPALQGPGVTDGERGDVLQRMHARLPHCNTKLVHQERGDIVCAFRAKRRDTVEK